ncbi:hypothetical protein CHS0354_016249 [Potamilus streckersoni]|uniref:Uncharacterized protein n=1 Tax=Potamilus streckersoni TaxID=2493646 RepID=A0AAE0RY02_9BIVA|nr:hypothetical protein CHS0354_016249 [Potamilus streckersoni]
MMMMLQKIVSLLLMYAIIFRTSALYPRRILGGKSNPGLSKEREMVNKLLHRMLDTAYETFKDMGVSESELKKVDSKRALIKACYFHAVACY